MLMMNDYDISYFFGVGWAAGAPVSSEKHLLSTSRRSALNVRLLSFFKEKRLWQEGRPCHGDIILL